MYDIDCMNIINLDINIIKALDVLLEEKNVSKAALRLGITQPAMSNALNRIRDIFSDPILVRTSAGMEPSLKALKIYPQVKRAIQELEQLFVEEKLFDPSTSEYSFNIGASDYASIIIAPILVKHLEKDHPNIRLHIHRLESDSLTQGLQSMNLDFVLGTGMRSAIPEHLFSNTLFQDQFACAMSEEFSKKDKAYIVKKIFIT
jgi:DNA-binding transcriptional LysR family regulator